MYPKRDRFSQHRRARLDRIPEEGWVAGVCAGVAEYLDVDPTAVRVITVLGLVLLTGPTILAYLIAWAIVPKVRED